MIIKIQELYTILLFLLASLSLSAQDQPPSRAEAVIHYQMLDEGIQFSAITPPLHQIAGAPPAFYSYFWEFGDGQFSFEKSPVHIFPHTGEFEARLYLTNNYDDGKPPPGRPKKLYVNKSLVASAGTNFDYQQVVEAGRSLKLQINHDPKPDEELVCIFSYKNRDIDFRDGRLYLFFNERKFKDPHFAFGDARVYHGETRLAKEEFFSSYYEGNKTFNQELWASTEQGIIATILPRPILIQAVENDDLKILLDEARDVYQETVVWEFDNLEPAEERHLFTTLLTTKEMLADTNAIISMQAIYAPEGGQNIEVFTLDMQIVASHDPNHIAVSDTRVNFRRAKRNDLTYKVRFQNIGEGPASEVRIETSIPKGLDPGELELLSYYPYCPICPEEPVSYSCLDTLIEEDKVTFFFHNIYLPGMQQEGVFARDSTKGFIKFKIQPAKNIKRINLDSRANIFFDKNPPIRTNSAVTQFTGWAPGFKAGVDLRTSDFSVNSYFAGITISPVKASKWYYQGEVMLGYGSGEDQSIACVEAEGMDSGGQPPNLFVLQESNLTEKTLFLEVVPLQFRRNLLDLVSIGAGTQLSLILNQKQETETITHPEFFEDPQCQFPAFPISPPPAPEFSSRTLPMLGTANLFVDVNVGMVKNGPVGGLRYMYSLNPDFGDRLQLYVNWKF